MRALRRRAIGCAAAAATGAVLFAGATTAQAQKPEKVGNGIPTGQMGVQMFNYGGWLSTAGIQGAAPPAEFTTGLTHDCLVDTDPLPPVQGGPSNDSRQTPACRLERLEALFKFLQRKGVTTIELFGHAGFPASTDIDGLKAYRELLNKYGLHAGGWHGSMNEAGWDARVNAAKILGADYIGNGNVTEAGINSYEAVLRSAQILNRLGKKAVEAGVGPAYFHNHEQEFDRMYVDNGVLKHTYDILLERTDPRYVVGELDVFWSSDAFDDVSGQKSAEFLDKWGSRIQLMHVKDGINAGQRGANSSRAGSPRATGTGEIDFRPIFDEAVDKIRYYHQEQDQGTLTDAEISLTNLKGTGAAQVAAVAVKPTTFDSVPANTPGASNAKDIVVQNAGDLPLNITNVSIQGTGTPNDSADFEHISNTCVGASLAPGDPNANPPVPRGSCLVKVGFRPSKSGYTSVARLQLASNAHGPTESALLVGTSTGEALGTVGGDVPSVMNLSIANPTSGGGSGSFGTFVPGVGANYTTALAATATTTTGNAELSVTDTSSTAPGHLVNGAFSLPSALGVRALGLGDDPLTAYQSVPESAGQQLKLKSWSSPMTAAPLTLGFRQSIGNGDVLRAGRYSKTLTFTLSTTSP